ncbi:MAG: hypothetical protein KKA97_01020, partial [Actinobacteria bacterium]|nr:hypothetical protein [Actinomycetota bacterium]
AIVQAKVAGSTVTEYGDAGARIEQGRGSISSTSTVTSGEVISVKKGNGELVAGDQVAVTYYVHADR